LPRVRLIEQRSTIRQQINRSATGTATTLFTDVVDSTAQRAALGEEAAERRC
jgi:hypothetical protein